MVAQRAFGSGKARDESKKSGPISKVREGSDEYSIATVIMPTNSMALVGCQKHIKQRTRISCYNIVCYNIVCKLPLARFLLAHNQVGYADISYVLVLSWNGGGLKRQALQCLPEFLYELPLWFRPRAK